MSGPFTDHNTRYPAPASLQGSGYMVLETCRYIYTDILPLFTFPFHNHDYSIGMWLHLPSVFETVTCNMQFNGFSLIFTLNRMCIRVWCSHAGGLEARASTRVPLQRWFHIVLTYSSQFQFYINGHVFPLICTEGPRSENQMCGRSIFSNMDGYLILFYQGYMKYMSTARFADIQVLPCALTLYEIRAIIEQMTCIQQLDMSKYLLNHWGNIHWYSKYLLGCILF
jgi:hypothetical protein